MGFRFRYNDVTTNANSKTKWACLVLYFIVLGFDQHSQLKLMCIVLLPLKIKASAKEPLQETQSLQGNGRTYSFNVRNRWCSSYIPAALFSSTKLDSKKERTRLDI